MRIAIAGWACEFPGAHSPDEFWSSLCRQDRHFREIPQTRLNLRHYRGTRDDVDRSYLTRAAVVEGWEFDRTRFGVAGDVHRAVDPTHWLALDVADRALADAGFERGAGLPRPRTGVVIGNSLGGEVARAQTLRMRLPYLDARIAQALERAGVTGPEADQVRAAFGASVRADLVAPSTETLAGMLSNTIAGRVANHFDLGGGGYTVDGACASSLLAVITACRALESGELDLCVAGGVDISLDPMELVGFSRLGALADDEMRVYDTRPTGFLPGEGAGMVVLATPEAVARHGLEPYAWLAGWGVSSDGRGGLTRPDADGHRRALESAWAMAGVTADHIGLVEGHGTGTAIGDPVELEVFGQRFADARSTPVVGSVKANIGHTKAAAGIASLLKASLAVTSRVLPPTTGCEEPHPALARAGLRTSREAEEWRGDASHATVSAMGFGGINTHVVIAPEGSDRPVYRPRTPRASSSALTLVVGADDQHSLRETIGHLVTSARAHSDAGVAAAVRGTAPTGGVVRAHLVAATGAEMRRTLEDLHAALAESPACPSIGSGWVLTSGERTRVGLLFTGQGAPRRASLGLTGRLLDPRTTATWPRDWDAVLAETSFDTATVQRQVLCHSLTGLAWLESLGLDAATAVGHSLGEISALVWSGMLDPVQSMRLVAERGSAMSTAGVADTGMVAVGASEEVFVGLRVELPSHLGERIEVACVNSHQQVVAGGPISDLQELVEHLRLRGIEATLMSTSHAFHTRAMAAPAEQFARTLEAIAWSPQRRQHRSTIRPDQAVDPTNVAALLVEQLTMPVRFLDAVMCAAPDVDVWLEVGPGRALADLAEDITGLPAVSLDSGGDPDGARTAAALALASAEVPAPGPSPTWPTAGSTFIENPLSLADTAQRAADVTWAPEEPGRVPGVQGLAAAGRPVTGGARDLLAAELELPTELLVDDANLMADLGLNSLRIAQVVSTLSEQLGVVVALGPLDAANTTVGELVRLLDDPPPAAAPTPAAPNSPTWVVAFEDRWAPAPGARNALVPTWRFVGERHPAAITLPATQDPAHTVDVLWVRDGDVGTDDVLRLWSAARETRSPIVVLHGGTPTAPAAARSIHAEDPNRAVAVVECSDDADLAQLHEQLTTGFVDLRFEGATAHRRELHRVEPGPEHRVPADGLVLLTGGLRGIVAECAMPLAERLGWSVLALGRSAATDLTDDLARWRGRGVSVDYVSCDLTDAAAVGAVVDGLDPQQALGVLHGAALNAPRPLGDVTSETFTATLAPKDHGLGILLAALDGAGMEPVFLHGFGSLIARSGLQGQGEYAVANAAMTARVLAYGAQHPDCLARVVDWSAWAETGMAQSLGLIGVLRSRGIELVPVSDGVARFGDWALAEGPSRLLVTARLPEMPTLTFARAVTPMRRFTERAILRTDEVEGVFESFVSEGSDLYLDGHRIDGSAVLPAVAQAEAAAQAVARIGALDDRYPIVLRAIELPEAVTVPSGGTTVRVSATRRAAGFEVDVRVSSDGFARPRFRTVVSQDAERSDESAAASRLGAADWSAEALYDDVYFHRGRMATVRRVDYLTAYACQAQVAPVQDVPWFPPVSSGELLLGDLGVADGTIHAFLACVPHRRVLPVRARGYVVLEPLKGELTVVGRETGHTQSTIVFDIEVLAGDRTVARWEGLEVADVGPNPQFDPARAHPHLLGPWLSRRLLAVRDLPEVELVAAHGRRADRAAGALAAAMGWPPAGSPGSTSASYAGDDVLLARVVDRPVAVDWEPITAAEVPQPADLDWSGGTDVDRQTAAHRDWTTLEALHKLGVDPRTELGPVDEVGDLWVRRGPEVTVASLLVPRADEPDRMVTLAVLDPRGGDSGS